MSEQTKKDTPAAQKSEKPADEVKGENADPKEVKDEEKAKQAPEKPAETQPEPEPAKEPSAETEAEPAAKQDEAPAESGDKSAEPAKSGEEKSAAEKKPEPAPEAKRPESAGAATAETPAAEAKSESEPGERTPEPAAEKKQTPAAGDQVEEPEIAEAELAAEIPERAVGQNEVEELEPALRKVELEERGGEKYVKLEDLEKAEQEARGDLADLEKLYEDSLIDIREQEIVTGKIIAISDKEVAVDIGFKSEGVVPIEEFADPGELKVGDQIEVYLDSVEDSDGQLSLSKRKADFMRVWERVKAVYAADGIIKGRCTRRIKGGMVVDLGGVDAFLPGSQIDVRPVRDFDAIIGTEMEFKILKINELRKNIVVSHKVLKEESLREVREKLLANLEVGQVLEGAVKNITDFGVFVDLGGVDGLLHITDLSWGRVAHPSEVVQLDQKIKVMVLNYDPERKRISLGLKQLYAHLWDEIDLKYRVGQKVQGRVVSLAKYGAFVEVEPGIEGLVHISEMSWTQHIKHPNQVVRENEYVQVVILNVDKENKKISLGLKQTEEDPWETFEAKYREGTRHKGIVRDLVPFGAFVELEDGIDGLVHISDLSWTRKVRHPGEILKKGEEIEVVVLSFNRDERRIALGHKQTVENPWDQFGREYPVGTRTTGTVVRLIDKGLIVEVPYKIEGFMPNSHISRKFFDGKKRNIQVGDVLNLIIAEFDKDDRRVILSNTQAEKDQAKATSSTLDRGGRTRHSGAPGTTIGDTLGEDLKAALAKARAEEAGEAKEKTTAKAASETAAEHAKVEKPEPKQEKPKPEMKAEAGAVKKPAKEEKPAAEAGEAKEAEKKPAAKKKEEKQESAEAPEPKKKKTAAKTKSAGAAKAGAKSEAKQEDAAEGKKPEPEGKAESESDGGKKKTASRSRAKKAASPAKSDSPDKPEAKEDSGGVDESAGGEETKDE
ncbi:MAG: 30S ribosomal protein S1 [Calditrichaeota bacterium]|nr:30S ribosomal protein S1 [Calditrichota bacterium]